MKKIANFLRKSTEPLNLTKKRELQKKYSLWNTSLYNSGYPRKKCQTTLKKINNILNDHNLWNRKVGIETLNKFQTLLNDLPSESDLKSYQDKHFSNLYNLDLANKDKKQIIEVLRKNKMLQQLLDDSGIHKEIFEKYFANQYLKGQNIKNTVLSVCKYFDLLGFLNHPSLYPKLTHK